MAEDRERDAAAHQDHEEERQGVLEAMRQGEREPGEMHAAGDVVLDTAERQTDESLQALLDQIDQRIEAMTTQAQQRAQQHGMEY